MKQKPNNAAPQTKQKKSSPQILGFKPCYTGTVFEVSLCVVEVIMTLKKRGQKQFENQTPGDNYVLKCFQAESELMTNGNRIRLADD